MRAKPVVSEGRGVLRMRGFEGEVGYRFNGDPAQLRAGGATSPPSKPLGGMITTSVEVAARAFREGRCFITTEGGRQCVLTVVAYTKGENRAFVHAEAV